MFPVMEDPNQVFVALTYDGPKLSGNDIELCAQSADLKSLGFESQVVTDNVIIATFTMTEQKAYEVSPTKSDVGASRESSPVRQGPEFPAKTIKLSAKIPDNSVLKYSRETLDRLQLNRLEEINL